MKTTDRKSKSAFAVLAAAFLALVVWAGAAPEAHSRPQGKPPQAKKSPTVLIKPSKTARILVVGDSLEVGTGPHLLRHYGSKLEVYARRGRPSSGGLQVLREQLRKRHQIVVFDQGSNDVRVAGSTEAARRTLAHNMRAARRLIGPKRCMVIATLNPNRRAPLNEVIRRVARRPNVVMLDWNRTINRHPELLIDNVHSSRFGYKVRAKQMIKAIKRCPNR